MGTGLDSFTNPENIGPLYPFVGSEVALVVIAIVAWLGWHVWQIRIENREYAKAMALYREKGLARLLEQDGAESLPDERELATEHEAPIAGDLRSTSPTGA